MGARADAPLQPLWGCRDRPANARKHSVQGRRSRRREHKRRYPLPAKPVPQVMHHIWLMLCWPRQGRTVADGHDVRQHQGIIPAIHRIAAVLLSDQAPQPITGTSAGPVHLHKRQATHWRDGYMCLGCCQGWSCMCTSDACFICRIASHPASVYCVSTVGTRGEP